MKKIFIILFFATLLCLLNSCSNEAKTSYEQLKTEYEQIDATSPESFEKLINKIDKHLSKFPSFKNNGDLENIKNSLKTRVDEIILEIVKNNFQECYSYKFQEYDEAIEKFNLLKSRFSEFIPHCYKKRTISSIKEYIQKIDNSLSGIEQERQEYFSAISTNNIADIERFLSNYPNSVVRGMLLDKIDEIYFSEFATNVKPVVNSISEVNNNISLANSYLNKIQNFEIKSKIIETISNLDNQRRPILETELNDKLQNLIEEMEYEARYKAEATHHTYKVEMCVTRGSNPEVVGYSSNFERIYQVNMKGSFLGLDKRELEIVVSGRIKGDINKGVTSSVTGSRIISDIKL